jgi:hypothetical protein
VAVWAMVAHCPAPSIAHYCPSTLCPTATATTLMVLLLPKSSVLIFFIIYSRGSRCRYGSLHSRSRFQGIQPSSTNSCSSRLRHPNMSKTDVIPDSAIQTCQHQLFQTPPSRHVHQELFFQPPPSKLSKAAVLPDSAIKTCHAVLSDGIQTCQ